MAPVVPNTDRKVSEMQLSCPASQELREALLPESRRASCACNMSASAVARLYLRVSRL